MALTRGLSDRKQEVRRGCVLALALIGSIPALEQVRQVARNRTLDPQLRGMALLGLGLSGQATGADQLLLASHCSNHTSENTRQGAILGLGAVGGERARAMMRNILVNPNHKKRDRMLAAAGLNSPGGTQDLLTLMQVARTEGNPVGEASILALGGLSRPSATPGLIQLTRGAPTRRGKGYAYLALGRCRDKAQTALLLARLRSEEKRITPWVALGLGLTGDVRARTPLETWISSQRTASEAHRGAVLALGLLGKANTTAIPTDVETAFCVSSAAGMAGAAGSAPHLWACYARETRAPDLRVNCVRALVMLTGNWAPYQKRLIADLASKDRVVRASAVRALGELPSYTALRAMIGVMRTDKDPYVRDEACLGVGNLLARGRHRPESPHRRIATLGFRLHPLALGGSRFLETLLRYLFS